MGPQSYTSSRRSSPWSEYTMGSKKPTTLATKKYVQRCMKMAVEKKELTITGIVGNGGVPTTAGRVDPAQTFNIIQGNADDQREGNFITRTKYVARIRAATPANAQDVSFRIILVHDKQTNGATPAITDILTTGTGGVAGGFNGDNVVGYGGTRFRVLRDSGPFSLNPTVLNGATPTTMTCARSWTWSFGPKGLGKVQFDATAGAITDIVSGELFWVTISDNATGNLTVTAQLCYTD